MCDLSFMLKRIKEEEKKKGYKHEDLARKAKIPLGTLSKVLAGITKDPSVTTIIKIANALNVSADYLIYGEKEGFQNNENIYSPDEEHIILSLRNFNTEGLQRVKLYIDDLLSINSYLITDNSTSKTPTMHEAIEEMQKIENRERRTDRLDNDGITRIAAYNGGVHEFYDDEDDED